MRSINLYFIQLMVQAELTLSLENRVYFDSAPHALEARQDPQAAVLRQRAAHLNAAHVRHRRANQRHRQPQTGRREHKLRSTNNLSDTAHITIIAHITSVHFSNLETRYSCLILFIKTAYSHRHTHRTWIPLHVVQ